MSARLICCLLLCCVGLGSAVAESLRVAVKAAPPFAMQDDQGDWRGMSVELWRAVASERGWENDWQEVGLQELLDGTAAGRFDVGVGAITANAEREERCDFSHPFLRTGLGIAIRKPDGNIILALLHRLMSWNFLRAVGALSLLLLAIGFLVWLFERRRNEQFGGSVTRGLGSGFWWSAVTMTTVGYGDKAPATPAGRLVALVWMFASIIIISGFTATIASSLTVDSMQADIRGLQDLHGVRVGVVEASSAARFADARGFSTRRLADLDQALAELRAGTVDAVIHDRPILRWSLSESGGDELDVLADEVQRQDYAFVLPPESPLRESINIALLRILADGTWERIREKHQ